MKKCIKCNRNLYESDFQKNKVRKDGLQMYCRNCTNEYNRMSYYKNHDKQLERDRKIRQTKEYQEYHKKYNEENKEKINRDSRDRHQRLKDNPEYYRKRREYWLSKHCRELNRIATRKYKKTTKGKESAIRALAKRKRNLNWIKLWNNPFPSDIKVHWHHVNDMLVVPMPAITHDKIISVPVDEHRERANLWMFYFYGNFDVERLLSGDTL